MTPVGGDVERAYRAFRAKSAPLVSTELMTLRIREEPGGTPHLKGASLSWRVNEVDTDRREHIGRTAASRSLRLAHCTKLPTITTFR